MSISPETPKFRCTNVTKARIEGVIYLLLDRFIFFYLLIFWQGLYIIFELDIFIYNLYIYI